MSFLSRIMVLKSKAHFSTDGNNRPSGGFGSSTFEGVRKRKSNQAKSRVVLLDRKSVV